MRAFGGRCEPGTFGFGCALFAAEACRRPACLRESRQTKKLIAAISSTAPAATRAIPDPLSPLLFEVVDDPTVGIVVGADVVVGVLAAACGRPGESGLVEEGGSTDCTGVVAGVVVAGVALLPPWALLEPAGAPFVPAGALCAAWWPLAAATALAGAASVSVTASSAATD